jgi:hypothetical protein
MKCSLCYITRLLQFTDVCMYGCAFENLCAIILSVYFKLVIFMLLSCTFCPDAHGFSLKVNK